MITAHLYCPTSHMDTEGFVALNYSVSPTGVPEHIEVVHTSQLLFEKGAIALMADWRFTVPPNWASTGGPGRRFRARVDFILTREGERAQPGGKWDPNNPVFDIHCWPD